MNENEWDWRACTWYDELMIRDKRTQPTMLIIITHQQNSQSNSKNRQNNSKNRTGHRQAYGVAFH